MSPSITLRNPRAPASDESNKARASGEGDERRGEDTMADDISLDEALAVVADDISFGEALAVVAGGVSISLALGAGFWALRAYHTGQLGRGWRWLRVQALGGVTTLDQTLTYNCAICNYSLDAREKVRKLSCGHVFHYRRGDKCKEVIDKWLCERSMTCPVCYKTALTVWPWKARPSLSAAPAPAPATPSSASASASGSSESLLPLSSPVLEEDSPLLTPQQ